MRIFKTVLLTVLALWNLSGLSNAFANSNSQSHRVVVAYVTSWSEIMPDPMYMTHINYAFGHVNETFNGVRVDNPERLKQIVALKKQVPNLKVLVSIGGWGSGRFSEMAADTQNRKSFAKDCKRIIKEYNLDGIDIDWEYPTSSAAGISSSPDDTRNFTLLMQDIRKAIGKKKLLTFASVATAKYVDFPSILPYIDFVNTMTYDMANAPKHHSALFQSEICGNTSGEESIQAHLDAGVPADKLVMGMPFYGRGGGEGFPRFRDLNKVGYPKEYTEKWDEIGKVPYLVDKDGRMVLGFENVRSLRIKCQYILEKGLKGGMYWEYSDDTEQGDFRKAVYEGVILAKPFVDKHYQVLVITEGQGQHKAFSDAALHWLIEESKVHNFTLQVVSNTRLMENKEELKRMDLIIQLDFPPYTWSKEAEKNFMEYMHEGQSGWIGFHHATLLGDFDGYPMWQWFSDFMGGIRFNNYIAPLADGKVIVEDTSHPVMKGLDAHFILPDDEWYTYDRSPRPNVKVLANVDESSYTPASDIKMGDHPVVWSNEKITARNVYFQMGHSPKLFDSPNFTTMFRNAIKWTLKK